MEEQLQIVLKEYVKIMSDEILKNLSKVQ